MYQHVVYRGRGRRGGGGEEEEGEVAEIIWHQCMLYLGFKFIYFVSLNS